MALSKHSHLSRKIIYTSALCWMNFKLGLVREPWWWGRWRPRKKSLVKKNFGEIWRGVKWARRGRETRGEAKASKVKSTKTTDLLPRDWLPKEPGRNYRAQEASACCRILIAGYAMRLDDELNINKTHEISFLTRGFAPALVLPESPEFSLPLIVARHLPSTDSRL